MPTTSELRSLHATALADTAGLIDLIDQRPAGALDAATPCAGWSVRDLIRHLVGQNHGFALAVREADADVAAYRPVGSADADLTRDWRTSADELTAAFAQAPDDRLIRLTEIAPDAPLPLGQVIGIQMLDTAVHAWDLAGGLGQDYRPEQALVQAVAAGALEVPAVAKGTAPGLPFGADLEPEASDPWTVTLARLGRRRTSSVEARG